MGEGEREGEREKEHMHVGEKERERALWLCLLHVFASPWACPVQTGLSQECCLFYLKSSLWSSDLLLFYFRGLFPSLSFSHRHFWTPFPYSTYLTYKRRSQSAFSAPSLLHACTRSLSPSLSPSPTRSSTLFPSSLWVGMPSHFKDEFSCCLLNKIEL